MLKSAAGGVGLALLALFLLFDTFFIGLDNIYNEDYTFYLAGMRLANGELPLRDFVFFPYDGIAFFSYLTTQIFGHRLISDFSLYSVENAAAIVLLAYAARRASGSWTVAALAAFVCWALDVRLFNAFKPFCLSLSLLAIVLYLEHPTRKRLAFMGFVAALASYMRIDLGLIAAGSMAVAVLARTGSLGPVATARAAGFGAGIYFVFAAPLIVYTVAFGGLSSLVGPLATWASEQTQSVPGADDAGPFRGSPPWSVVANTAPFTAIRAEPMTSFRTEFLLEREVTTEEVGAFVQSNRLAEPRHVRTGGDGQIWLFTLTDLDPAAVRAVVQSPIVRRARAIDLKTFAVVVALPNRWTVQEDLLGISGNSAFFGSVLFFLQILLVVVCAAVAVKLARISPRSEVGVKYTGTGSILRETALWWSLSIAGLLSFLFLSRFNYEASRQQDGHVIFSSMIALLCAIAWQSRQNFWRIFALTCAAGSMTFVWLYGEIVGSNPRFIGRIVNYPAETVVSLQRTWQRLLTDPIEIVERNTSDPVMAFARYIRECLAEDQKVFYPTYIIKPAYFAERGQAGPQHRIFPLNPPLGRFSDRETAAMVLAQDAPLAFANRVSGNGVYFPLLEQNWPAVWSMLNTDFEVVRGSTVRYSQVFPESYTIWMRRGAKPSRFDSTFGLPCFTPE